jgi:TolB protein
LPPIPEILKGKIAFLSDRGGGEIPGVYLLDPETRRVARLTDRWPYEKALLLNRTSPDGEFRAEVTEGERGTQVYVRELSTGIKWAITFSRSLSYDPAWSPRDDVIAYVSQEMGAQGGSDEIFSVNPQGSDKKRLTFNTWEWDKHPTFSPDGMQIVFWSNQTTGLRQLWIMNVDGSSRRILLESSYNDWDPVWIK